MIFNYTHEEMGSERKCLAQGHTAKKWWGLGLPVGPHVLKSSANHCFGFRKRNEQSPPNLGKGPSPPQIEQMVQKCRQVTWKGQSIKLHLEEAERLGEEME